MKKLYLWKRILIMFGIFFCLLTSVLCTNTIYQKHANNSAPNIEGQIDDFSQPITDIDTLIAGTINGYIYFGRDTCPICKQFNVALSTEYKSNPNLVIYKFDTDYWRDNQKFQQVLDQYTIRNVPCLIKKENSTIQVFGADDTDESISQNDLHQFLTT